MLYRIILNDKNSAGARAGIIIEYTIGINLVNGVSLFLAWFSGEE
jgi:hypothetical protein